MGRAFLFPGQGSQLVGMGKDFFDVEIIAKEIFDRVNDILGYNLTDIIFNGNSQELAITNNAQPALMATSIAILKVMQDYSGKKIDELCQFVAGHSLGEYTAFCAANSTTLEETTRLLQIRSNSMINASRNANGSMAACIGISYDKLQIMLSQLIQQGICQIANDNVEGQIVISGHDYNIDIMINELKNKGYRAIKLNVTGAFHSDLIKDAEIPMKEALDNVEISSPVIPVISNVSAEIAEDAMQIKTNLLKQICSTVRWRETMNKLAKNGVYELVEIGPGKVLAGLAKKSHHNFIVYSVESITDLEKFLRSY